MADNYKKGKPMIMGQHYTSTDTPFLSRIDEPKAGPDDNPSDVPTSPKEVAEYSAELLTELRDLATASGLTFLAYLIQVALEEAKIQADEYNKD